MVTDKHPGSRWRLYIAEQREAKGLSMEQVAAALGVTRQTVWRWENEPWRLDPIKMGELAHALGIKPEQFWHPPSVPSVDAELHGASKEEREIAVDIVRDLVRRRR